MWYKSLFVMDWLILIDGRDIINRCYCTVVLFLRKSLKSITTARCWLWMVGTEGFLRYFLRSLSLVTGLLLHMATVSLHPLSPGGESANEAWGLIGCWWNKSSVITPHIVDTKWVWGGQAVFFGRTYITQLWQILHSFPVTTSTHIPPLSWRW